MSDNHAGIYHHYHYHHQHHHMCSQTILAMTDVCAPSVAEFSLSSFLTSCQGLVIYLDHKHPVHLFDVTSGVYFAVC